MRNRIAVYHHHGFSQTPRDVVEMLKRTGARAFKTSLDRITTTVSKVEGFGPDLRRGWSLTSRRSTT